MAAPQETERTFENVELAFHGPLKGELSTSRFYFRSSGLTTVGEEGQRDHRSLCWLEYSSRTTLVRPWGHVHFDRIHYMPGRLAFIRSIFGGRAFNSYPDRSRVAFLHEALMELPPWATKVEIFLEAESRMRFFAHREDHLMSIPPKLAWPGWAETLWKALKDRSHLMFHPIQGFNPARVPKEGVTVPVMYFEGLAHTLH